jgi:hypothetical protein
MQCIVDGKTERAVDGAINAVLKIPQVIPIKTLLDSHPDSYRDGNNLGTGNEPDMVDELKGKAAEEERRGLRMYAINRKFYPRQRFNRKL